MFAKFGEFGSAEEINQKAEELFNAGDNDGIRTLASENGIPSEYAEAYCEGDLPALCDALTAAVGKLDMEEEEIVMVGVMEDWLNYIQAQCMEDEQMSIAVRKKGRNLVDCLGKILLWSLTNQKKSGQVSPGICRKAYQETECESQAVRDGTQIPAVHVDRDPEHEHRASADPRVLSAGGVIWPNMLTRCSTGI